MVLVLDQAGHRLGLGEDPADLLGRGRGVDGDGDRADRPERVVEQGPLVAGAGHQRDPVAVAHAAGEQALGEGEHLVAEVGGGDVLPRVPGGGAPGAVGAAGQLDQGGGALRGVVERVGQSSGGRRSGRGGGGELAHDPPDQSCRCSETIGSLADCPGL